MTVPTPAITAAAEACPFVNRDALLRALEAAAPHIAAAAFPRCTVPCDSDCEQLCHAVHDDDRHRDHEPEQCRAVQLAAAAAAERARLREPVTVLTGWLEHLPQRHVPLRAAEALLRLRNLTAPDPLLSATTPPQETP